MNNGLERAHNILRPTHFGKWYIFRLGFWHVADPAGKIVREDCFSFRHALLFVQSQMVSDELPPKKPPVQERLDYGVPR